MMLMMMKDGDDRRSRGKKKGKPMHRGERMGESPKKKEKKSKKMVQVLKFNNSNNK